MKLVTSYLVKYMYCYFVQIYLINKFKKYKMSQYYRYF